MTFLSTSSASQFIPVITIDGPSGSGKGTLAAMLADYYGFHLLDSGAIYRALGLQLFEADLMHDLTGAQALQVTQQLPLKFVNSVEGVQVFLNNVNVSAEIRTERVGSFASQVAAVPTLREALIERQRNFAQLPGLVADGRDMGTLIFPHAQAKIFLTASVQSRAERRFKQLQNSDNTLKIDAILADLQARDARDMSRTVAPLQPAADALLIDSSMLDIQQVFVQMQQFIDAQLPH